MCGCVRHETAICGSLRRIRAEDQDHYGRGGLIGGRCGRSMHVNPGAGLGWYGDRPSRRRSRLVRTARSAAQGSTVSPPVSPWHSAALSIACGDEITDYSECLLRLVAPDGVSGVREHLELRLSIALASSCWSWTVMIGSSSPESIHAGPGIAVSFLGSYTFVCVACSPWAWCPPCSTAWSASSAPTAHSPPRCPPPPPTSASRSARPVLLTQPIGCHRVATGRLLLVGGCHGFS